MPRRRSFGSMTLPPLSPIRPFAADTLSGRPRCERIPLTPGVNDISARAGNHSPLSSFQFHRSGKWTNRHSPRAAAYLRGSAVASAASSGVHRLPAGIAMFIAPLSAVAGAQDYPQAPAHAMTIGRSRFQPHGGLRSRQLPCSSCT
uniref:Uncharacterized protein n=1 Tax=uncultured marine virus TaxID=186617 RepID=A0A0F7L9Q2_9VIRU|nr:hypothetical protein [uncultured marine virus]